MVHGGDIYGNAVKYDFSANINPLGMPLAAALAAREAVSQCGHYPDIRGEALREAIAEAEGVPGEWIMLGNGASELIYGIANGLRPGKALGTAPAFGEYERAVRGAGGEMWFWTLRKERDFILGEEILSQDFNGIELLFLCNPNNPTGSMMERDLLLALAELCERKKIWFCLDECFLPFAEREAEMTMKPFLKEFPHLVILRAFTKVYGMPGLRLGYGLSSNPELRHRVQNCLPPWNVSLPAQRAGVAALDEPDYLERTRRLLEEERKYLTDALLESGLADKVYPSQVNFLFFHSTEEEGGKVFKRLLSCGILIRDCGDYCGLGEGYYRIAVRTHEENLALVRALGWQSHGI